MLPMLSRRFVLAGLPCSVPSRRLVVTGALLAAILSALVPLAVARAELANPHGVAVIIGNGEYEHRDVPDVTFAHRDADAFRRYVVGVLGYDPEDIIDLRDATRRELYDALGTRSDPRSLLWSYLDPDRGSEVVVFYSGHGVPGVNDARGYLLPVDADPKAAEDDGYPIDLLHENLGGLVEARSVRVYLDACFSGGSHAGGLIRNASPVYVTPSLPEGVGEKVTSLSAASGKQVASWDEEAGHGLFTHHLLDALYGGGDIDEDGRVTALEAKRYLDRHMTRAARRQHRRIQQASLIGAANIVLASAGAGGEFPSRPALDDEDDAGDDGDEVEVPGGSDEVGSPAPDAAQALHRWVQAGDLKGLRASLAAGAEVNARDARSWTALMYAAHEGHVLMVPVLLRAEADLEMRAVDGATALHMAARRGYVEVVEGLLEAGADVSVKDAKGNTAREEAQAQGHAKVVAVFEAAREAQAEREQAELREAERERQRAEAEREEREQAEEARRAARAQEMEQALGLTHAERVRVQGGLAALGLDVGLADGVFGRRTRAAVRAYQKEKGLAETGYLTREQSEALVALGEQGQTEEAERRADDAAYGRAESAGTAAAYARYVRENPRGRHVAQAKRRIAAMKTPAVGERFRDCDECPELVVVPSGSFEMGSPSSEEGRDDDEGPVHRVRIAQPFAVGVYEVTFSQWEACVAGGGCRGHRPSDKGWGRGNRPVINVSWKDAKAYVEWLSRKTGKGYRLLSESEWEYVARAGTRTPFHTGRTISTEQANYNGRYTYGSGRKGRYRKRTTPVGEFPANRFGLHDVHGNVWEWVEDCWNGSYRGAPADGSAWKSGDCSWRVLRGGSWSDEPRDLRSADRGRLGTGIRLNDDGFRVARTFTP